MRKSSESFSWDKGLDTSRGPQGTVSTVVLEDERSILQTLTNIKDLLSQQESSDADLRELLFVDESWIIRYAIAAPV